MAIAFNTQGATPQVGTPPKNPFSSYTPSNNPVANILNKVQSGSNITPSTPTPSNPTPFNMSTVNGPASSFTPSPGNNPGLLSQPVKSHTTTNTDGSTTKIDYHKPEVTPQPAQKVYAPGSEGNAGPGNGTPNNTGGVTPNGAVVDDKGNVVTPAPTNGSAPNANLPGLINSIGSTATGNLPIGQSAANIAADYGKKISDVGIQGAKAQAGYQTTGTTPVAEGNAAVIANTTANQQKALAEGESAALQGTGQQLTAQNQATSGLIGAGGLSTPSNQFIQVPYSNQVIGSDGKPVAGGTTSINDAVNAVAAKIKNGTLGYNDGLSQLSGYGQAGANALTQVLGPGFNINASNATAAAQNALTQTAAGLKSAEVVADGVKSTIQDYLRQNPGLNPSDATFANSINQWISGQQLGDPKYQTLVNYLSEYTNKLAPILGVGGDTTNLKTEIAQSFINGKAKGSSISQVLDDISSLAHNAVLNSQSGATGGGTVAGGYKSTNTVPPITAPDGQKVIITD